MLTGQLRLAAPELSAAAIPPGSSLSDALLRVADSGGPTLRRQLVTGDGRTEPTVIVVVNGRAIGTADRAGLVLADGDEILLMPPIAGG